MPFRFNIRCLGSFGLCFKNALFWTGTVYTIFWWCCFLFVGGQEQNIVGDELKDKDDQVCTAPTHFWQVSSSILVFIAELVQVHQWAEAKACSELAQSRFIAERKEFSIIIGQAEQELRKKGGISLVQAEVTAQTVINHQQHAEHRRQRGASRESGNMKNKEFIVQVKFWDYIGPFAIGKSEFDGDPLDHHGGIFNFSRHGGASSASIPGNHVGLNRHTVPSELVDGGHASWTRIPVSSSPRSSPGQPSPPVQLAFPHSIRWQALVQGLNSLEVLEHQGWAVGHFVVAPTGRYRVACRGAARAYVDGEPALLAGDLYHGAELAPSLRLDAGIHTLFVPLRAKMNGHFGCHIEYVQPGSELTFFQPHFLPDIVDGILFSHYVAIPVNNAGPEAITLTANVEQEDSKGQGEGSPPPLTARLVGTVGHEGTAVVASGQTTALRVVLGAPPAGGGPCPRRVPLVVTATQRGVGEEEKTKLYKIPLLLRCRSSDQSFIFTFLDHDGTVSQAAGIAPLGSKIVRKRRIKCSLDEAPVLLSLHGTTIKPQDQADSYKQMKAHQKEYTFGVKGYWVLAPTRHGAANWEHGMSATALASLAALEEASARWAAALLDQGGGEDGNGGGGGRRCGAARARRGVLFAGHSMGGHGAWYLATHAPDYGLGVASVAGWIKKEYYGDSNSFMVHDISTSYIDTQLQALLLSSVAENQVDHYVSNLAGIPALTRVGSNDMTVNPWYARRMHRLLISEGINSTYTELPGKEHWWWDTHSANDGGATNDEQMRAFFQRTRDLQLSSYQIPTKRFTISLYNPSSFKGKGGIRPLQLILSCKKSTIKVAIEDESPSHRRFELQTQNIRRLQINHYNPVGSLAGDTSSATYVLDGEAFIVSIYPSYFCLDQGLWKECNQDDKYWIKEKTPSAHGPIPYITLAPLIISVGSGGVQGSRAQEKAQQKGLRHVGLYLANMYYHTTDAHVQVVQDTLLLEEYRRDQYIFSGKNIIFVGGPAENVLLEELMVERGKAVAAYTGDQVLVKGIHPDQQLDDEYSIVPHEVIAPQDVCAEDSLRSNQEKLMHYGLHSPVVFDHFRSQNSSYRSEERINSFSVGPSVFNEEGLGLAALIPLAPIANLGLIMAGVGSLVEARQSAGGASGGSVPGSTQGLALATRLAVPTIPPMARAPLTNLLPDYIVLGPEARRYGFGGVRIAGHWGAEWKWEPQTAFVG